MGRHVVQECSLEEECDHWWRLWCEAMGEQAVKDNHDINCARMLSPDPTAPCTCNDELQRLRTELQKMLAMMDDPNIHFDTEWWKVKLRSILGQESGTELSRNEAYWQSRFVAVENKYNLLRQKLIERCAEWREGSYRWHPSTYAQELEAILNQEGKEPPK